MQISYHDEVLFQVSQKILLFAQNDRRAVTYKNCFIAVTAPNNGVPINGSARKKSLERMNY